MQTVQFHHHPDNRIIIRDQGLTYNDFLDNFRQDYSGDYTDLPEGVIELRYTVGQQPMYITTAYSQVVAERDTLVLDAILAELPTLIATQESRQLEEQFIEEDE